MTILKAIFWGQTVDSLGIAGCYVPCLHDAVRQEFEVPLSWELSVAVYPELVEGSLTSAFGSLEHSGKLEKSESQ
jgi:hypothetical protein